MSDLLITFHYLLVCRMSLTDIEARIAKWQLLPVLTAKPAEFYSQMQANVYPLLSGSDHDILASYFRLFDSCDVADAKNHIKLLKMVSSCLPGLTLLFVALFI